MTNIYMVKHTHFTYLNIIYQFDIHSFIGQDKSYKADRIVYMCTPSILTKGNVFCDFVFASKDDKRFQKDVYFKGKNLLHQGAGSFLNLLTPTLN